MGDIKSDKHLKTIPWLVAFSTLFVAFSVFLNDTFTSDHVNGYKTISQMPPSFLEYIQGGRILNYFTTWFCWLMGKAGISKLNNELLLQLLVIIFISCAVSELSKLFDRFFVDKEIHVRLLVLPLIMCMSFVNPFFVETFVYVGYELALAIWLVAIAVRKFTEKKYIHAGILLFLAMSVYQSYFALFLIWTTVYIYLDNKDLLAKKPIVEIIKSYVITIIPMGIIIALPKLLAGASDSYSEVKEVSVGGGLADKVLMMIKCWYHVFITELDMMPKCTLLVLFVVVLLTTAIIICKKEQLPNTEVSDADSSKSFKGGRVLINYLLVVVLINLYYVAIYMTGYDQVLARVSWPAFASIAMLVLILTKEIHLNHSLTKNIVSIVSTIAICIIAIYSFIAIKSTQTAATDYLISNKLAEQEIGIIEAYIEAYEKETGNEVNTVYVLPANRQENTSKYLISATYRSAYAHKPTSVEWSNVELLNYLTGNEYDKQTMSETDYNRLFADNDNWNEFMPDEQLVFEENAMYWCVY